MMLINKIIITQFILTLLFSCSSIPKNEEKGNPDIINRSKRSVFNYEYEAKDLTSIAIETHFKIRIEIEKPYIIKRKGKLTVDEIFPFINLEGMTIFKVDVDKSGRISSYKIVKSAGLGIDELLEKVLKGMRLSPLYQAGESKRSSIEIKIEVVGKDKI